MSVEKIQRFLKYETPDLASQCDDFYVPVVFCSTASYFEIIKFLGNFLL